MRNKFGYGLFAILTIATLAAVPPLPPPPPLPETYGKIILEWDHPAGYPQGNTNWLYRIYSSTDLTNWTPLLSVSGTTNTTMISVKRGQWFFYATTINQENFWVESDPSNVAQTPALPLSGTNLTIKRGSATTMEQTQFERFR